MIDKSTHAIKNSKSCTDLMLCTNENIISKYSVDASFSDKCHPNIIYSKINIRVPLPLVSIREVWNYTNTDVQNIQKTILDFNWRKDLDSLSVDSRADPLHEILLNIFRNYIPNKQLKCDYLQPPWITDDIKKSLKKTF